LTWKGGGRKVGEEGLVLFGIQCGGKGEKGRGAEKGEKRFPARRISVAVKKAKKKHHSIHNRPSDGGDADDKPRGEGTQVNGQKKRRRIRKGKITTTRGEGKKESKKEEKEGKGEG